MPHSAESLESDSTLKGDCCAVQDLLTTLLSQPVVLVIMLGDLLLLGWIIGAFAVYLKRYADAGETAISAVRTIAEAAARDRLSGRRARDSSDSTRAQEAWDEYEKTLFSTADAQQLLSTDDAEGYFNERTLVPDLFKNSLLAAIPSVLTAAGVLATFLGLTVGLSSIDISADADADTLMEGINALISSAGVSFVTSVAGVISSLAATILLKHTERRLQKDIATLEAEVDGRFQRYSAENGLYRTDQNTRESAEALSHLHEKIGAQLQTAVGGLSDDMQSAFITAMNQVLAPALAELTRNTTKQSSEVFEALIGRFSGAFEEMGTSHATAMQSASGELVKTVADLRDGFAQSLTAMQTAAADDRTANASALADMQSAATEQLASIRTSTAEQISDMQRAAREQAEADRTASAALMEEMRAAQSSHLRAFRDETAEQTHALQSQMTELSALATAQQESSGKNIERLTHLSDQARKSMEIVAEHLTTATTALETVASEFTTASGTSASRLSQAAATMESLAQRQTQSLEALDRHAAGIDRLAHLSSSTADKLSGAAGEAKSTFELMTEQHTEFLSGLESALSTAQQRLTSNVEGAAESMSTWLTEYSETVRSQTNERLSEWNSQTTEFASQMLETSRALSNVIDEIEGKTVHGSASQTVR